MDQVYPVYILSRVVRGIFQSCVETSPKEMLGRLLGYRLRYNGVMYTKIVDWASGEIDNSHVHANFTPRGTRECEFFVDERYGNTSSRPKEVGLFHSHPFGSDPHFSSTDYDTFLAFPYDQEGNVFVLIDPLSHYFKVFSLSQGFSGKKSLVQVKWICYAPKIP